MALNPTVRAFFMQKNPENLFEVAVIFRCKKRDVKQLIVE